MTGCDQISQWRFPNTLKQCPIRDCRKKFQLRTNAIAHFKKNHAKKSVFCRLCDKPLEFRDMHHFEQHYRNFHPMAALPFDFDMHKEISESHESHRVRFKYL